jgi:radical SAM protein with 4Fe4S-binding SPASM domain
MLKFLIDHQDHRYRIQFDMPVTPAIQQHSVFSKLIQGLSFNHHIEIDKNKDKEVLAIGGPYDALLEFADQALSPGSAAIQKKILSDLLNNGHRGRSEGLQVNFHQKPFDTVGRYWNFILNQGHFIDYFFNRINWYATPKNRYVTPFPLHVDLESASTCNMKCPMCYRGDLKKTGQMDVDLFKKAVDECAQNNVFSIRLSWRGETLTHPRIKEMIAYAAVKIKNVSFLTNAFYLNEDICDCLIENRVSYVAVSFDGIGDNYETIRHPAKFEENYQRLGRLLERRTAAGRKLPQIRLCTIWPAIKDNPDLYRNTMRNVSDYLVYNPYINFRGPMKIKPDFICQYPWERIVISFDGNAQCCTGWNADDIILGNVGEKSIYQMWHSNRMNQVRETHATGGRMQLNSCANCRHGSQGDPNVDIREIVDRRY